jgi:uncharacterized glyoxalase superfamily protein PhnB
MDAGAGWNAMQEFGLQGIAYQEVFGPGEPAMAESMKTLKEKVERHRCNETETQRVGVSPHAPYTVSETLYKAVRDHARAESLRARGRMLETETKVIPILRIFDEQKAREFYVDFLGFAIDWQHRFADNAPLYTQVSRGEVVLHLSEHYGDACPGSAVLVLLTGIRKLHQELIGKNYKYMRPSLEKMEWNALVMQVLDPFGNKLRFSEDLNSATT